jgi:hypothetical protein
MKTQDIKDIASAYMQVQEKAKMDKVNPKALDKDFDDRQDKDIDNDGDVDKSDEYLHNRRKAVKKAMKDDEKVDEGYAKSAAQQAAIAIAKKEKGMSEDDDLDELSLSVKDFKKTGLNKTVTKDKDKLKKDIEAMKSRLKKEEVEIDEAAPKMQGDWLKKQREKDREHNAAMGRTATGRKKPVRQMTSTQRSLAKLRGEETEVDEAMSKATRRALQSVKAQPKDKVSLKPAPWDKKKDTKNMSMKEKLQLQKEAILEREMTDAEMKKREDIVKGMKKNKDELEKRYGSKWKDVMYATATKQAMESVDKALSMTKGLLTTKESFDTEDTKWPVYAKIKENRAMQTKGAAPGDPKMMDKMTASDKAFIDAHSANDLDGIDSGIDGAKAAADTAKNAAAQVKAGAGMNRTGDQKTGDKNIVKSTEAK